MEVGQRVMPFRPAVKLVSVTEIAICYMLPILSLYGHRLLLGFAPPTSGFYSLSYRDFWESVYL